MLPRFAFFIAPMVAAAFAGNVWAMTSPSSKMVECRVIGGGKLPADSGGPDAFCAAIQRAATAKAPGVRLKVEARVRGATAIAAKVSTADGRTFPELEYEISDRGLTRKSLERFAESLVGQVARSASR